MPAIRPERLKREMEELQELVGDPAALRWRVVELLEFYSDRTKRYGIRERIADATMRLHVHAPVMQALKSALHQATGRNQERAYLIANELWSVAVQEARLLGVSVLANASSEDLIDGVQSWAKATLDEQVQNALAEVAYTGLTSQGDDTLRNQLEKWLLSRNDALQNLGLSTLQVAASDDQCDKMQLIFEILSSVGFRKHLISKHGYAALLESLSTRTPSETAGFLLNGLKRNRASLKPLVKELASRFPPPQRKRIEGELL